VLRKFACLGLSTSFLVLRTETHAETPTVFYPERCQQY
jgi:hypothetical protein